MSIFRQLKVRRGKMKEEEFFVALVKFITKSILTSTRNQSEAQKIITIGVQSALNTKNEQEK
jgi:hypothetical protein